MDPKQKTRSERRGGYPNRTARALSEEREAPDGGSLCRGAAPDPAMEPGRQKGIGGQLARVHDVPIAQIEKAVRLEGVLDPQGELPRVAVVVEGPLVDVFSGGLGIALTAVLVVEDESCGSGDDPEEPAHSTNREALAKVHDGVLSS